MSEQALADEWIRSHQTWLRATEITVPVKERIGPFYRYGVGGGWYAALVTDPNPSGELLDECDHHHASEDDAWTCAAEMSLRFARKVLGAQVPGESERSSEAPDDGETCCHLHKPVGCCDANDCGPCCENCPTCPTLNKSDYGGLPDA